MPDLQAFFVEQRTKYEKQRDDAMAKLDEAEAELRALDAYDAAKKSKKPRQATLPLDGQKQRKPRETGKRMEVLNLVQEFPSGATSSELQDKLGIKGDKKATQSLSNALSALKQAGQVTLANGTYRAT